MPDGVELVQGAARIDVEILEDGMADVHVVADGKTTPRTLVIAPQPALRAASRIARSDRDGVYTLAAPGLSVQIKETASYSIEFLDGSGKGILRSINF